MQYKARGVGELLGSCATKGFASPTSKHSRQLSAKWNEPMVPIRAKQRLQPPPPPPTRYRRSSTPQVVSQVVSGGASTKAWGSLHLAIHRGSSSEVRELLARPGVDKEELLERSFTPLLLAAQYGRADCIAEVNANFFVAVHRSCNQADQNSRRHRAILERDEHARPDMYMCVPCG